MEEAAAELYEKETDESRRLHEMLGLGVGVFQGKPLVPPGFKKYVLGCIFWVLGASMGGYWALLGILPVLKTLKCFAAPG